MERYGFCVVKGLVQKSTVDAAAEEVRHHVRMVLQMKDILADPANHFKELLTKGIRWDQTPSSWEGARFGGVDKRGWMQSSGTGRLFDDWCPPGVQAAQEAAKPVISLLRGCLPEDLELAPERCSIKVVGCPELLPNLDLNRRGDFQTIIALTETSVVVWPGSHKLDIGPIDGTHFYRLSSDDPFRLGGSSCKRLDISVGIGDAVVMMGGLLVHGSPAGEERERICTYASFTVKTDITAAAQPKKRQWIAG